MTYTTSEEHAYMEGMRAAWTTMLSRCLVELRITIDDERQAYLELERMGAVRVLRELCANFGDNDWDETLDLSDVIDKHLGKYLWSRNDR